MNFENQEIKKQVLIAGSDSDFLRMLSFLLVADGFGVVLENGIKKAIESLGWRTPDLVLLDLQVSTKDNTSTFSAIRKMQSHPPMVFLVKPQLIRLTGKLAKNGNRQFVTKPIDYHELRKHLRLISAPAPDLEKVPVIPESVTGKTRQIPFNSVSGPNLSSALGFSQDP